MRCGGPLPPEAARAPISCPFCGATSVPPPEVVAVGRVRPMGEAAQPETRMFCPRCSGFLDEREAGATTLLMCNGCTGVWLDAATVARLERARDADVEAAAHRIGARVVTGARPDLTTRVACPVCKQSLQRRPIPGTSIAIDVCAAHGTWFDRDDAHELVRFLEAYGARADGPDDDAVEAPKRGFFASLFGR